MIKGRCSIIIPCYNHAQYLSDAIDSAKAQTYEDIEIIVVDDGSTQDLSPVMHKYRQDVDWIHYYRQENQGLSSARNNGIANASGEWILPLDSDDKIHRTFVAKAIQANSDIVSSWLKFFGTYDSTWSPDPQPSPESFLSRNQINCCSMFRKEMWKKLGGYDEGMRDGFEDYEFWIRATKAGYKVVVLQEALFFYRKHGRSMIDMALTKKDKIVKYMKTKHPDLRYA